MKNQKRIDYSEILSDVEKEVRNKNLNDIIPSLNTVPMPETLNDIGAEISVFDNIDFEDSNVFINQFCRVMTMHPFCGNRMIRGIKHITYLIHAGYLTKIVENQNTINQLSVRIMNHIRRFIFEDKQSNEEYEQEILTLVHKTSALRIMVDDLEKRVQIIKNEVAK